MADTQTANYKFVKPEVGASATTWGAKLNSDLDMIDAQLFTSAGALSPNNLNLSNNPGTGLLGTLTFINATVPPAQQTRWMLAEDASAEVGGSAGSNLSLFAFNDTGGFLSTPLAVNRASGAVTFGNATNFTGLATFATISATTLNATTVNGTTVAGNALYSNTTLNVAGAGNIAGGLYVNNGLTVQSGLATFSGGVGGATSFNSNISVAGTGSFGAISSGPVSVSGNVNATNFVIPAGGSLAGPSGGSLLYDGGSWQMNCPSGNFLLNNNGAFKPGGGAWAALSDARIKTVTAEYETGLEEVLQLRPVIYTYKTGGEQEFVGLVAQEVEQVMPGMVGRQKGFIDGEEVDDLRTLDTTELIFALVNSVRQLKAEIDALKR